jgi:hypothetical protein
VRTEYPEVLATAALVLFTSRPEFQHFADFAIIDQRLDDFENGEYWLTCAIPSFKFRFPSSLIALSHSARVRQKGFSM